MSIYVDAFTTYDLDTPRPPGFTGDGWAHLVSDVDLAELTTAAGDAVIRTPTSDPASNVSYAVLTEAQRTDAITAGALEVSGRQCFAKAFDAPPSGRGTYEP